MRLMTQTESGAVGTGGDGWRLPEKMLHPKIESLDRDAIKALQARKLTALGSRLAASPAWREHFAAAGMHPRDLAATDGLAAAPTLEKSDLRAHYPVRHCHVNY